MSSELKSLRLGTRGSLLARTQSQLVATQLEATHAGLRVELVIIKTTGDIIADKPLHDAGGKGLFTKELELALLAGEVDFAVHSFKDVPVTMPLVDSAELVIAATPRREDPRDVLAMRANGGEPPLRGLSDLPNGAKVGTGSLRRRCQILLHRPDVVIQPIRGNIDTRLRKLDAGEHDAIILAMAGLRRTGLFDPARMIALDPQEMLPSPGQGALALQCRRGDEVTRHLLAELHHPLTATCVAAERELILKLHGDCHSPIAALAKITEKTLHLRAAVGGRDGGLPVIFAGAFGDVGAFQAITNDCFESLSRQNVEHLLAPGR